MENVDLHLHTTASDGSYTPQELVIEAAKRGLKTIAVTDHDTVAGIVPAMEQAKELDLEVIPGIEFTTYVDNQEVHILGYYIDHLDKTLSTKLAELKDARRTRGEKIVEKLNELGVKVQWQTVQEIAGAGAVGRPHIARALVEEGYVKEFSKAFDKYIGDDGPAYVPKTQLTPKEAIELIDEVGGIAVLAHPGLADNNEIVNEVIESGIEGLEVYYSKHTSDMIRKYVKLAKRYELLLTGGSDCHGPEHKGEVLLGTVKAADWLVTDLKEEYRAKNGINLIDFDKYLKLYPKTSGLYPEELQKIGKEYHQKGYLTKDELYNLAHLNSTRSSYHVKKNPAYRVKKVTEIVYQLDDEFSQLTLLVGLTGIGIPTASAILTSLNDTEHAVIDTRVWATLHQMGYFDVEKESFTADDYLRIMEIIRKLALETDLSTAKIGYALFAYDVEHREGTLH
ncbi:PHP domain-containing protein [Selenihalanaerobacter shriftii]|uniref:Predicted metal-dependent phosphoesterase TrpH, contains PHP domain n=1 Tax=Selenihalanaerobacter shriftii TaxID=142842 RepID=A0A1T4KS13_9FIRM|nr:PHP domain-containing protein [Selenihalanaerobacter shriftii]SJZ45222.1 Predicted metal-dependent phosphoesterase TrpH, contains PHP domain [Selenihalanaerobacter shriftii]